MPGLRRGLCRLSTPPSPTAAWTPTTSGALLSTSVGQAIEARFPRPPHNSNKGERRARGLRGERAGVMRVRGKQRRLACYKRCSQRAGMSGESQGRETVWVKVGLRGWCGVTLSLSICAEINSESTVSISRHSVSLCWCRWPIPPARQSRLHHVAVAKARRPFPCTCNQGPPLKTGDGRCEVLSHAPVHIPPKMAPMRRKKPPIPPYPIKGRSFHQLPSD